MKIIATLVQVLCDSRRTDTAYMMKLRYAALNLIIRTALKVLAVQTHKLRYGPLNFTTQTVLQVIAVQTPKLRYGALNVIIQTVL